MKKMMLMNFPLELFYRFLQSFLVNKEEIKDFKYMGNECQWAPLPLLQDTKDRPAIAMVDITDSGIFSLFILRNPPQIRGGIALPLDSSFLIQTRCTSWTDEYDFRDRLGHEITSVLESCLSENGIMSWHENFRTQFHYWLALNKMASELRYGREIAWANKAFLPTDEGVNGFFSLEVDGKVLEDDAIEFVSVDAILAGTN